MPWHVAVDFKLVDPVPRAVVNAVPHGDNLARGNGSEGLAFLQHY